MAKPKPLPMPVDVVLGSKHLAFASGPLERAVWCIACRFWLSGAVLDGFDESTACQVAKIQGAHWERLKTPLMAALGDILPELAMRHAAAYASREHMRAMVSANGSKGRMIMWERQQARRAECAGKIQDKAQASIRTPKTAARYVDETNPMTPQALAALPKREVEIARMADK